MQVVLFDCKNAINLEINNKKLIIKRPCTWKKKNIVNNAWIK